VTSRPALRQGYARTLAGRDSGVSIVESFRHFDETGKRKSRECGQFSISRWENIDCRTESAVGIDRREQEASRESSRLYVHSTTPGASSRDVSGKAIA